VRKEIADLKGQREQSEGALESMVQEIAFDEHF